MLMLIRVLAGLSSYFVRFFHTPANVYKVIKLYILNVDFEKKKRNAISVIFHAPSIERPDSQSKNTVA